MKISKVWCSSRGAYIFATLFALVLTASPADGQYYRFGTSPHCELIVTEGIDSDTRIEDADHTSLYILNPDGTRKRILFTGKGALWDIKVSPRCDYVACGQAVVGQQCLILVNLQGDIELQVPNVFRYAWSPDGASIAFILGIDLEVGLGFRPASIWVYQVDEMTARRVPCLGYDLAWAEYDGNLYILDSAHWTGVDVYRHDPSNNETRETVHHGIFFSPNGKHYYLPSYEGSDFGLYVTDTDADVTEDVTCFGRRDIVWFRGWLNDSILIRPSQTAKIFQDTLVNIKTDTQCVLPGEVVSFPIEGSTFKMWHEGKISDVALDSLLFTTVEDSSDK